MAYAEGKASTDSGTADAFALLHFGNLLGLRGDVAQVAAGVENDEIVSHNSILLAGRVYTHCTTGRWDSAQARLDHFAESNFARIPRDMTYGLALSNLAISCMLLRDRARAALLRPMLAPYANRNLTALCYYTAGCGAHFLGLIDGCMGEWKTANDHFEASIAMNREMGFRLPLATTLTAYAQACRRQGKRMQLRADALQKAAADLLRTMAIPASAILAFDAARPPGIS